MTEKKILILGSSGSVGKSLLDKISKKKVTFQALNSKQLDLLSKLSVNNFFKKQKNKFDILIIISAITPDKGKTLKELKKNIEMIINISSYLNDFKNIIYISSDAVYNTKDYLVNDKTLPNPDSNHGIMHLCREKIIELNTQKSNLTILRPTLLFGKFDTHFGYGPNRFLKQAKTKKNIVLFGQGKDKRDHLPLDTLSKIIYEVIDKNLVGTYNVATGHSYSFKKIAKLIANKYKNCKLEFIKNDGKYTIRKFNNLRIYKLLNVKNKFNIKKEINKFVHRK